MINLILFFLFAQNGFCNNGALVPENIYNIVSQEILSGNYLKAEDTAGNLIKISPSEPAGYLFKASVINYRYIDYEDTSGEASFFKLLDSAEKLSLEKLKKNPDDIWAEYFLYASKGLRGARATSEGRFFYGLGKGMSGASGMKKIIRKFPGFYDAYLLTGSYRFWKSKASWLPVIGDEREIGIREAETAIQKGKFTGDLSNTVLIEMLLNYNIDKAAALADEMSEKYPACRLFKWQLGEAYKKSKRYEDAVGIFEQIAKNLQNDGIDDGSARLVCFWKLAVLSKEVGKKKECLYYCNKVLELGKKTAVYNKQKERIEKALKLIGEINK